MVQGKAELHVLTEFCPFAMGFVIITPQNRAIIIDGGTYTEVENVKAHVGDRTVAAWILTHTDGDHIGCLRHMILSKDPFLDQIECFYSNFHTAEFFRSVDSGKSGEGAAKWVELYDSYLAENNKQYIRPVRGDHFEIDGLSFDILFSKDEKYTHNFSNDASLVFRVTGKKRNVLFLGDLGPEPGEELLAMYGDRLQSDIVQMAHHGHIGVRKNVYEAIDPNVCIWCAASWLWQEHGGANYLKGEACVTEVRKWMAEIGHQQHIVTKDGDTIIDI
jgi:beta-lactamase superfamily II metal-dependent hydrolase